MRMFLYFFGFFRCYLDVMPNSLPTVKSNEFVLVIAIKFVTQTFKSLEIFHKKADDPALETSIVDEKPTSPNVSPVYSEIAQIVSEASIV